MSNSLNDLSARIRRCHQSDCSLHPSRGYASQVVVGKGNPEPRMVFIGEAPGEGEDLCGYPFVVTRDAGGILTHILEGLGINRDEDIWIDNTVKCRPPNNRNPTYVEMQKCKMWLDQQLIILNPECIVLMGNTPRIRFLPATEGVTKSHGQFHEKWIKDLKCDDEEQIEMKKFNFLITYHPAYVARKGGVDGKIGVQMYEDLEQLIDLYYTLEKGWKR